MSKIVKAKKEGFDIQSTGKGKTRASFIFAFKTQTFPQLSPTGIFTWVFFKRGPKKGPFVNEGKIRG